jgi:hypothetical protein
MDIAQNFDSYRYLLPYEFFYKDKNLRKIKYTKLIKNCAYFKNVLIS